MVAHPAGRLFLLANDTAEFSSRKIPPICPLTSRATQKPSMLRPMKNAGIVSLTMPGSSGTNLRGDGRGRIGRRMPERSPSGSIATVERPTFAAAKDPGMSASWRSLRVLAVAPQVPGLPRA